MQDTYWIFLFKRFLVIFLQLTKKKFQVVCQSVFEIQMIFLILSKGSSLKALSCNILSYQIYW